MVGYSQVRCGTVAFAFVIALSTLAPACKKPAGDGKRTDCTPPTEEKLAEFVRLQSEGVELYKQHQPDAALAKLVAAQAINPCDVSVHNDLGITYHQQKKVKQAIEALNRGVEIDPLYPLTYLNLGMVYDETANFDEAVKAFNEFIKLSPEFGEAHRRLGIVYFKMSRYDDAKREMARASELKPDDWEPWYTLGNICFHEKDYAKASEYYAKTLALNPEYSEALYKQGTTLERLGKLEEAAVYREKFQKLSVHQERIDEIQRLLASENDRKHELYVALGLETMKLGMYDEAINSFQKSLKARPDNAAAWVGLADTYRHQKKYDEAIDAATKAKAIDPTLVPAYDSAMATYGEQGKLDLAVAEVRSLLEKKPDYVDAWLNLGLLEQRSGNDQAALAALAKVIATKPDTLLAHEIMLAIYTESSDAKLQDKVRALETAHIAERLGSQRFEFLAEAYHMNGDLTKAMALLEQGLQNPQDPLLATMKTHLEKIRKEAKIN